MERWVEDIASQITSSPWPMRRVSALAEETFADLIYPDKLIRLRLDTASILPPYLWRLLQLPAMRNQIERSARTAVGNFAIGSKDVRLLIIPLPPLETQKHLTAALQAARAAAQDKRRQAADLRESARIAFEGRLFHREPPQAAVGT